MHPRVKEYLDNVEIINGKKTIVGNVYVNSFLLTELNFDDIHVTGNFWCFNNKLTTLKGCPASVGGHFECYDNPFVTLEHCPTSVGGIFWIDEKYKLLFEQSYNAMLLIINQTTISYC